MKQRSIFFVCLVLVASLLLACGGKEAKWHSKETDEPKTDDASKTKTVIPRADPGYIQQLEKRSMLGNAASMARIVSGSHLGWGSSASSMTPQDLMSHADSWVYINPMMLLVHSRRTTFDYLGDSRFWAVMRDAGLRGVFVSPTGGSGRLWTKEDEDALKGTGDDAVQYDFADFVGNRDAYKLLISKILETGALLGAGLVPAATGLGPDFFLAVRNVREYPGAYCLVEVPEDLWDSLPEATDQWRGVSVPASTIDKLSAKGIVPRTMVGDALGGSGWAATSTISGVDGQARRWVYRYDKDPSYAVLNWEDPSRAASRILSGSAVRQVGMLGQSLIGLQFDAFHGVEAGSGGPGSTLGPSLSAAQNMSREINRYGGWAWAQDRGLSINDMRLFQSAGVNFVTDHALSPAAEHALLTGDASLLRFMADAMIAAGIDASRLVHTMPMHDGLDYRLPSLASSAAAGNEEARELLARVRSEVASRAGGALSGGTFYTTGAGLASMALGSGASVANVAKGHALLVFFKAMQPGLLMLSGQDLVGAMPLAPGAAPSAAGSFDPSYIARGSYSITPVSGTMVASGQAIAKAQQLYPHADEQGRMQGSFVQQVGNIVQKRKAESVGQGRLVARPETKNPGTIALLTELGNGCHLLTVTNFSRESVAESIDLGKHGVTKQGVSTLAGSGSVESNGNVINFSLGAWQGKAALIK